MVIMSDAGDVLLQPVRIMEDVIMPESRTALHHDRPRIHD